MPRFFATLLQPSGVGRYLSFGLAIAFSCSAGGLLWIDRDTLSDEVSVPSAILLGILISLCGLCVWLIDQFTTYLRQANYELGTCRDIYFNCSPSACASSEDILASEDYALTIQDLYNNAPCGYHSIDANGRVVLMNDTELHMLGYKREQVIGRKLFFEFVAPESIGLWMGRFEVLKQRGWVKDLEINLQHRDGHRFPVLINSTAVWDKDGNYQMSRSTIVDVSQRKRTEHALRQSEARYRGIVEDQTELICRFLPGGRITFVNQAYCRYFGMKAEDLIGKSFTPNIPKDDLTYVQTQFSKLSIEQPMVHYEHRVILRNGKVRWHAWTDRAIFDEQGLLIEYQGVGRDISDQYFQAAAVHKLSKALEMAVVGIAEVSPAGRYVQVNDAYAAMSGYAPNELITEDWLSLIDSRDQPATLDAYQVMMTHDRAEVEVHAVCKQGDRFDQKIVLVKAYDQQQQFVGHYCFTQDISARRELDRLKDEFVSIVSHELRTPLTSIAGALDLLASGVLQERPEQSQRMVMIAAQNTERLVRMINDILDVERIRAGKVVMQCEQCGISDILQQSIDVMQPMAERNGITLKLHTVDAIISVDRDRIIQVMTNLLSNAIKFSEPHTQIEVYAESIDPRWSHHPAVINLDEPSILISVRDQGRGIPDANLTNIFEPFQQVDASDSRQKGGSGLGLAICRSILQQHHASFWVESQVNQGSVFYFMLPIVLDSSTSGS